MNTYHPHCNQHIHTCSGAHYHSPRPVKTAPAKPKPTVAALPRLAPNPNIVRVRKYYLDGSSRLFILTNPHMSAEEEIEEQEERIANLRAIRREPRQRRCAKKITSCPKARAP
jgi:hypothetical protein